MEYIQQFVIGFVVGFSGAMIPGPLLVFAVSRTMRGNVWTSLKIIVGHMIVELGMVIVILLGLGRIRGSATFIIAVSIIGGAAMMLLGTLTIAKAPKYFLPDETKDGGAATSARGTFRAGLVGFGIYFILSGVAGGTD